MHAERLLKEYLAASGHNQQALYQRLRDRGCDLSIAKLSRIMNGLQPVTLDVLEPLSEITGIPEKELRPDLARHFIKEAAMEPSR